MPKNHIDVEFTEKGCKLYIQTHPRDKLPYTHETYHNGEDYLMLKTSNSEQTDYLLYQLERVISKMKHQKLREDWLKDIDDRLGDIDKNEDSGIA